MEMESKLGLMVQFILVSGSLVNTKDTESNIMSEKLKNTKAIGLTDSEMDKVSNTTQMDQFMMENGSKINYKDKVYIQCQMEIYIRVDGTMT